MKQTDRFLLGMVVGILLLVAVTLALVLRRPQPGYQPDDTAAHAAHNYLLALQQRDYQRAYTYLSPALANYPLDEESFRRNLNQYSWYFRFADTDTLAVTDTVMQGNQATVTVTATHFERNGPFGDNFSSTTFQMELEKAAGEWKLVAAENYWIPCWSGILECR